MITETMITRPSSSVLLVNHPKSHSFQFGVDVAESLEKAKGFCEHHSYSVIVQFGDKLSEAQTRRELQQLRSWAPRTHILLIKTSSPLSTILQLKNLRLIQAYLHKEKEPAFSLQVQTLLADYAEAEQRQQILELYNEQNRRLQKLNSDLEERVEKRQKYLLKSQEKLRQTKEQISFLHQSFLSVFRGESIAQIEAFLFEVLENPLDLDWLKIRFSEQNLLLKRKLESGTEKMDLLEISLSTGTLSSAHLMLKKKSGEFSQRDVDLLSQLSETLGLAIGRILKRQDAEGLKQQWESTFDAISAPLCLTDEKFRILRTNRSYSEEAHLSFEKLGGTHALASLLGPEAQVLEERLKYSPKGKIEAHKIHQTEEKYFSVSLHPLERSGKSEDSAYMILFEEITEQKKMERQLLETSKMAELGIIGSSIAHELNNPIGGMTNFLQLIKMDLSPSHPLFEDIQEMEQAAKRCKNIVENLLGFARKQESEESVVDLKDVLTQAIHISELQTRSTGLTIEAPLENKKMTVSGTFNQLVQAFQNILKNSLEACLERAAQNQNYKPKIQVKISENSKEHCVAVIDNGLGIPKEIQTKIFNPLFTTKGSGPNSGLGLTVAFKIITEHKGRLEITSRLGRGTTAKVSFQRLDL